VPSENDDAAVMGTGGGRVARKREARREALLDLAAALVEAEGVDGVTMAALAEAADYAPASLYTYFPSRSALLASLQRRALATLGRVAEEHLAAWDAALAEPGAVGGRRAPALAALARLWAFSDLFLDAPTAHPREFRLQQQLLVTPAVEETADAAAVVPAAMAVLDVPRRLLDRAVAETALEPHHPVHDPLEGAVAGGLTRTLAWVVALNGALLVDGLATGLPMTGVALGGEITGALLVGWGADPAEVAEARRLADDLLPPAPAATSRRTDSPSNRNPTGRSGS
jgi:AcrR family transcriptional regulator